MSGTFPTAPVPSGVKIRSVSPTSVSVSHSMRRNVRSRGAQRWAISLSWATLTRAQLMPLLAFCMAQRGQFGSFQTVLAGHRNPQGIATGTPAVNGSGQSGRSVNTKGWSTNVTGIMKAGDFIKFANQTKVYMVTADANSDGTGLATLTIEPALMVSPADSDGITVRDVPFTVAMTGDAQETQAAPGGNYSWSLDLIEDA